MTVARDLFIRGHPHAESHNPGGADVLTGAPPLIDGTLAAPALAPASAPSTGFYFGAGFIALGIGAVEYLRLKTTELLVSGAVRSAAGTASLPGIAVGDADLGLWRVSAANAGFAGSLLIKGALHIDATGTGDKSRFAMSDSPITYPSSGYPSIFGQGATTYVYHHLRQTATVDRTYTFASVSIGGVAVYGAAGGTSASVGQVTAGNFLNNIATGSPATIPMPAVEIDVNNNSADMTEGNISSSSRSRTGLLITGLGTFKSGSAIDINMTGGGGVDAWLYGVWVRNYDLVGIRVGTPAQAITAALSAQQKSNGADSVYLQRFTDSSPTGNMLRAVNAANTATLFLVNVNGDTIIGDSTGNRIQVTGSVSTNPPAITALGASDANVGLSLVGKGTGGILHPIGAIATPSITFTGDTGTGRYWVSTGLMADVASGVIVSRYNTLAAGVDYFDLTPGKSGTTPQFAVLGGTTDIGIAFALKNGGRAHISGTSTTAYSVFGLENLSTAANTTKSVAADFFGRDTINSQKNMGRIILAPVDQDWNASTMSLWGRTGDAIVERLRLNASGVLVPTAVGLGYGTGAGGAVTQITSSATSVTLNKPTGQITTVALTTAAAAEERFTVNNTSVAATDCIALGTTYNGAGLPAVSVVNVAANAFDIVITNLHATNALNALMVINFAVIKAVAA